MGLGMSINCQYCQKSPWQLESICATQLHHNTLWIQLRICPLASNWSDHASSGWSTQFSFPVPRSTQYRPQYSTAVSFPSSRSSKVKYAVKKVKTAWGRSCCPLPMTRHSDLCSRTIIICEMAKAVHRGRNHSIQLWSEGFKLKRGVVGPWEDIGRLEMTYDGNGRSTCNMSAELVNRRWV